MEKITILLADDHRLLREMWEQIFNADSRFKVIGSTGNGEEAVKLAIELFPDIILMDIAMSPVNGFEATERIRRYQQISKIIGVSMYNVYAYANKMLKYGAMGYITKNSPKDELINGLLQVHHGRKYICKEITNDLTSDELIKIKKFATHFLTLREIEILSKVKEGYSSKEISQMMNVRVKTIEVHRYNMLKKLKLRNTAALINFANEHGL